MIFVYLILLIISVVFYIMYIGSFSFYLMVFMIVLPIILFALNAYLSRRLRVYFTQAVQKATVKTPLQLEVVVENPTVFPVANIEIILEYHSTVDKGKNITRINSPIMPKETHSMQLNIASLHLGAISFKLKKCRIYDFLRIFKFKLRGKDYARCMKESTVFILPKYSRLDNAISDYSNYGMDTDEYSPDKKGDDPSQIFDIHEYIEGDKPNRIHWKLSAKQDSVMVKDYSLPMTFAISIFINLNTDDAKFYDAMIESAMSISMMLTERGSAHCISWYDASTKSLRSFNIKDEQDHIDCADALIKTKTYSDNELEIYPFADDEEQISCAHLIVVSKPLEDTAIDSITETGFAARYTFVFAVKKPEQMKQTELLDNVSALYVHTDHIADAFSDIVF